MRVRVCMQFRISSINRTYIAVCIVHCQGASARLLYDNMYE